MTILLSVLTWTRQTIRSKQGAKTIMVAVRRRKGQPYSPAENRKWWEGDESSRKPIDTRGATRERMDRAKHHDIGGDERTGRVIRVSDSPLDGMRRKGMVDSREYAALDKLRHHWWHANLSGSPRSADLNRVWASDALGFSHMARSEREAHHRAQYRKAMALFSHLRGIVVTNSLFSELPLHLCIPRLGKSSDYRTRESAKIELRGAANQLIQHWGL